MEVTCSATRKVRQRSVDGGEVTRPGAPDASAAGRLARVLWTRGHEAEEHADRDREEHRERDDRPIDDDSFDAWDASRRRERDEETRQPHGEGHAGDAGEPRDHDALGHQLTNDAGAARPDGEPQRQLSIAPDRADQEQRRGVGAGDQQQQRDRRREHRQHPSHVDRHVVFEAGHRRHDAVAVRIAPHRGLDHRREIGARLIERDVRLHPSNELKEPAAVPGGIRLVRNPDVMARSAAPKWEVRKTKSGGEHTDDGAGDAVDADRAPDDGPGSRQSDRARGDR